MGVGDFLPFLRLGRLEEGEKDVLVDGEVPVDGIRIAFDVSTVLKQGGFNGKFKCMLSMDVI